MKAAGIVILFPLISIVIVSLYVHGGASRVAALVLVVGSVAIALFASARRAVHRIRNPRGINDGH